MSSNRYTKMGGSPKFDKPVLDSRKRDSLLNNSSQEIYVPKEYFRINRNGSNSIRNKMDDSPKISFVQKLVMQRQRYVFESIII